VGPAIGFCNSGSETPRLFMAAQLTFDRAEDGRRTRCRRRAALLAQPGQNLEEPQCRPRNGRGRGQSGSRAQRTRQLSRRTASTPGARRRACTGCQRYRPGVAANTSQPFYLVSYPC